MIKTETFKKDGIEYVRTYSDAKMKIHGGFPEADYDEAVDPSSLGRTYTETDIPIEDEGEMSKEEAFDEIFGEDEE